MIYFTSDLHFGHINILRHCDRPFADIDEMDRELIARWNRRVTPQDDVYILGDLFYRNQRSAAEYLRQLAGHKYLILGNHDVKWLKGMNLGLYFENVSRMEERKIGDHFMTLCHYPMLAWSGCARGHYLVHGHIHNSTSMPYWPVLQHMDTALNAGVDINDFQPVTLEELIKNNAVQKQKPYVPSDRSPDYNTGRDDRYRE